MNGKSGWKEARAVAAGRRVGQRGTLLTPNYSVDNPQRTLDGSAAPADRPEKFLSHSPPDALKTSYPL
jgi:hypothetical protein